jgi:hypothetical protein
MPGDYTNATASALAAIERTGVPLVVKRETKLLDMVTEAPITGPTAASYPVSGVVFPISESTLGQMSSQILEKLARRTAYQVLVAGSALAIIPEPGDTLDGYLNLNGWEILGNNCLAPSGTPVLHQLLIAR